MKTFHIEAEEGQIAKTVLMPGDPMRAKYIAEHYLTDVICYSQVRGMNGYTGYYNGKKVSVQGSGMGIPSMGIYSYELFNTFGVDQIIRVGTCGAVNRDVEVGSRSWLWAAAAIPILLPSIICREYLHLWLITVC